LEAPGLGGNAMTTCGGGDLSKDELNNNGNRPDGLRKQFGLCFCRSLIQNREFRRAKVCPKLQLYHREIGSILKLGKILIILGLDPIFISLNSV
jgi:hypothetical protein